MTHMRSRGGLKELRMRRKEEEEEVEDAELRSRGKYGQVARLL